MDESKDQGWIDVSTCEAVLTKDLKLVVAIDGSDVSMTGFAYVVEMLQKERKAFVQVVHVYDDKKDFLPVSCRSANLLSTVDATLTGSVSLKRYKLSWIPKAGLPAGEHVSAVIDTLKADYVCVGFYGLKGRKNNILEVSSNVHSVLSRGNSCSAIVMKDESPELLPQGRPCKFVVSVSLNKSSTKAFLDALRLSRPGDEIHVVYVKSLMESEDDYTTAVRVKYTNFFAGLQDGREQVFSKFQDRITQFSLITKRRRETTPDAVVRYADEVDADFIAVGANAADRISRGKNPVGVVSMQICLNTTRNFIVSNWININAELFEACVRRVATPGSRPSTRDGSNLRPSMREGSNFCREGSNFGRLLS